VTLPFGRNVWLAGAVVSLSLLALVLARIDLADVRRMAAHLTGPGVLLALASRASINLVCGLRLARSFGRIDRRRLLAAVDVNVLHGLLLALLPARLGDLYYPLLLRRLGVGVGRAAANLLLLRLFDALVLCVLFAGGGLVAIANPGVRSAPVLIAAGLLFLAAAAASLVLPQLCGGVARLALRRRGPLMRRIARQALDGRRWLGGLQRPLRLQLFLLTILYWASSALTVWVVMAALGVALSAAQAVFIAAGLGLAGALPLQTIAGFGVGEASLALLLAIVGFPAAAAASIGVVARLGFLALPVAVAALWLTPRRALRWEGAAR
jgi:uncharacterized membrane protein YbhN (UPF0104 family)